MNNRRAQLHEQAQPSVFDVRTDCPPYAVNDRLRCLIGVAACDGPGLRPSRPVGCDLADGLALQPQTQVSGLGRLAMDARDWPNLLEAYREDFTVRGAIMLGRDALALRRPISEVLMHMLDWNGYRDQVLAGVGDIGKLSPETVRGYAALGGAGAKTGHLDAKIRELIALACAVSQKCDGCIAVHAEAARKLGATREEIAEALGVAISIGAGAALVYSTRTLDAFAAAQEAAGA